MIYFALAAMGIVGQTYQMRYPNVSPLRRLLSASLLAATGCAGGQSGAEGEALGPPCPLGEALVLAHITELTGGCVGIEVQQLVSAGVPVLHSDGSVLFDGTAEQGEGLRGRLMAFYAYTHEFQLNETVAGVVGLGDYDELTLQLLPVVNDQVQIDWDKRRVEATLAELAAPDCQTQLKAKYDAAQGQPTGTPPRETPGAAAPEAAACNN